MKRKSHFEHYREEFALKVQASAEKREIFFHRQTGEDGRSQAGISRFVGNAKYLLQIIDNRHDSRWHLWRTPENTRMKLTCAICILLAGWRVECSLGQLAEAAKKVRYRGTVLRRRFMVPFSHCTQMLRKAKSSCVGKVHLSLFCAVVLSLRHPADAEWHG